MLSQTFGSETFALALVKGEELVEENAGLTLESYPKWSVRARCACGLDTFQPSHCSHWFCTSLRRVNRLAKTGTSLGIDDGKVCDVNNEARQALGEGKVGWNFKPSQRDQQVRLADGKRSQKKELTDKQKAALAKLKAVK